MDNDVNARDDCLARRLWIKEGDTDHEFTIARTISRTQVLMRTAIWMLPESGREGRIDD